MRFMMNWIGLVMRTWKTHLRMDAFKATQSICLDALHRWWRERTRGISSRRKTPLDLTTPWQQHHQDGPAERFILGSTAVATVTSVNELVASPLFDSLHDWWKKYTAASNFIAEPRAAKDAMQTHRAPWNRQPKACTLTKAQLKSSAIVIEELPRQQTRTSEAAVATWGKAMPSLPSIHTATPWQKVPQSHAEAPRQHDQTAPWRARKAHLEPPRPPPRPVKSKTARPPSPPSPTRKVARTWAMQNVYG